MTWAMGGRWRMMYNPGCWSMPLFLLHFFGALAVLSHGMGRLGWRDGANSNDQFWAHAISIPLRTGHRDMAQLGFVNTALERTGYYMGGRFSRTRRSAANTPCVESLGRGGGAWVGRHTGAKTGCI